MAGKRRSSEFFRACRQFYKEIFIQEIEGSFYEVMDKFASRYGWDHNKILNLPAHIFIGYYAAIKKSMAIEFNQQLQAAAFTAWRIETTIVGVLGGAQNQASYPDYLSAHALLSEQEEKNLKATKELQKMREQLAVKQGIAKAEKIMQWDTQRTQSLKKSKKGG